MEPQPTPTPRRRRTLLASLLTVGGLALAVPAGAALAGGGDSTDPTATEARSVQERDRGGDGRDKRDCPEHERGGAEREDSSTDSFDESREL